VSVEKNTEIDVEKLWDCVFHGSPTIAAIALAILNQLLNGKISELKKKVLTES